jgi:hypothetical protein
MGGWRHRGSVKLALVCLIVLPPMAAWLERRSGLHAGHGAALATGSAGGLAAPIMGTVGWPLRREAAAAGRPRATQKVPRVLHQVWKTHAVPADLQGYVDSWRRENPEWTFRIWNDTESLSLIKDHYPWFYKHIHHFKSGVEKADIFRYFILYHHGGVYMDLDMECLRPWDPLLQRHDETFQCVLGAVCRLPIYVAVTMPSDSH